MPEFEKRFFRQFGEGDSFNSEFMECLPLNQGSNREVKRPGIRRQIVVASSC